MDRRLCNRTGALRRGAVPGFLPRRLLFALLAVTAFVLARAVAAAPDAVLAWLPLRCPLKLATGLACPTCGLGHALLEAAAGDFAASWRHHPAGVSLLGAALLWLLAPRQVAAFAAAVRRRSSRPLLFATVMLYVLWGFGRAA
jgi:hypothetical protein